MYQLKEIRRYNQKAAMSSLEPKTDVSSALILATDRVQRTGQRHLDVTLSTLFS